MRHYYTADQIREAEAPLLASLPDGVLMRRAANGLATAIARELVLRTGGITGRRVCAIVGSGDNGGDALWAATFLRRRGAAAAAILLKPERTHRAALAAFRRAGGRVVEKVPTATDLVVDGVVGISGSGPLRRNAAEGFAAVDAAGIPVVAVDIPSGVEATVLFPVTPGTNHIQVNGKSETGSPEENGTRLAVVLKAAGRYEIRAE